MGHVATETDRMDEAIRLIQREALANPPEMTVAKLMSYRPIATCRPDQSVDEARQLMRERCVRHLVVLDLDGRPVGILGIEDLRPAGSVGDVMHTHLPHVTPEDPAAHVGRLLRQRNLSAVPVMRDDRLVGILTASDYLYLLSSFSI